MSDRPLFVWRRCWRAACSVRVAVVLMALIALACIVATLIPQRAPDEFYLDRYGRSLRTLFRTLRLTDVFHSGWFAALMALFAGNLLCCTIHRRPITLRQLGFLLAHAGTLLFFVGCIVGLQFSVSGFMTLDIGESACAFQVGDQLRPLPFEVHLDDFVVERYEEKQRVQVQIDRRAGQLDMDINERAQVADEPYSIEIVEHIRHAYVQRSIEPRPEPGQSPAIELTLSNVNDHAFLVANDPAAMVATTPDGTFIGYLQLAGGEADVKGLIASQQPVIQVTMPARRVRRSLPARMGETLELPEHRTTVEVLHYFSDFRFVDGAPKSVSDRPNNPCMLVKVITPEGESTRYLFAYHPGFDSSHGVEQRDLGLRLIWPVGAGYERRLLIVEGPDLSRRMLHFAGDGLVQNVPAPVSEAIKLAGTETIVRILKALANGRLADHIVNDPQRAASPAVRVEVRWPGHHEGGWLILSRRDVFTTSDNRLAVMYAGRAVKDRSYKSTVRVLKDGQTVAKKIIEVNYPLKYGGYHFYQHSYNPQTDAQTTLQVTRNPGLWMVYAGFALMTAGVTYIFYIKPFVIRRRQG